MPTMTFLKCLFWISCFFVFYNYAGYAIIAHIFNTLKKKKAAPQNEEYYPTVSFIVAAYNEEDCIEQKIMNSLDQDYPANRIEFIFITDGSTDDTNVIIQNYPSVQLLHTYERNGKSAALNRAVQYARHDILLFSDANTVLNKQATRNVARHYQNPDVGGVAGEKKVMSLKNSGEDVGKSEGLYWKYESVLKKIDSDFLTVVGAAGELFSVRKELYETVPQEVILDDFIISMKVAQKGYRIIYEPEAYAMELPSFSIKDEKKRKVRIAAGGFQAISLLAESLSFWKHFKLSYLYISHRVLRWAVSPFCLILALVSNGLLSFYTESTVYKILFLLQVGFYLGAFLANASESLSKRIKILKLSYYFIFMNISVIHGFFRFLRRKQPSTWEKVKRSNSNILENQAINQ
jgi:cellulose synthase/poly-beta-1,6-N-acetylglucosamine synthase-like glycosyltransferase